jgi:DNA-binding transcriptional MerR regulator
MSLPTERPSAAAVNGPRRIAPLPARRTLIPAPRAPYQAERPETDQRRGPGRYRRAEVAHRIGVGPATLRAWERQCGIAPVRGTRYAAADVVRLEVLGRLVRSGVPVARAVELVCAAQYATECDVSATLGLPKSGLRGPNWICATAPTVRAQCSNDRAVPPDE